MEAGIDVRWWWEVFEPGGVLNGEQVGQDEGQHAGCPKKDGINVVHGGMSTGSGRSGGVMSSLTRVQQRAQRSMDAWVMLAPTSSVRALARLCARTRAPASDSYQTTFKLVVPCQQVFSSTFFNQQRYTIQR